MPSPYQGLSPDRWADKTRELIAVHPLSSEEIVGIVLSSWEGIFESAIGKKGYRIGTHLFPKPQVMGFLLQDMIVKELEAGHPGQWRGEDTVADKDLVYIPDGQFSFEMKTSSDPKRIFGNRSYAQRGTRKSSKKSKAGYYVAVNYEKFSSPNKRPRIRRIRFGWLDEEDWIGQAAATGQQARLDQQVERGKLVVLYSLE